LEERIQRELAASEKRFRSLLESGTDLILAVDREGRIQYASPSSLQFSGYAHEELIGRLAFDFVHPDDRPSLQDLLQHALQRPGSGPLFETKIQRKDGAWIDVESRANPIFLDPQTPGLVLNCRDVSERKKAEERQRFQKTLLESQSECSLEGVVVSSCDGQLLHSNRRFAEIWNLGSETGATESCQELWRRIKAQVALPDRVAEAVQSLTLDFERTLHDTCRLRDGRTIDCYTAPVRHKSGLCFGRLWSCRDITEQVRLHEQVRHSQRLDSIGVVSAGIAHEFKNFLGPILGNAELAQMDLARNHPAQTWLKQIVKSAQAARDLVQLVLTFSRRATSAPALMSLGEVVTDAVRMLRVAIPKTVEISRAIAPNLPKVFVDANQIHQVIMNLGINAWQAMPDAKGQICISLDLVSDKEEMPGDCLRLLISDTGSGMDANTLERLFEPFFTTKPAGVGTGLGLAVVHGIVTSHHGIIDVQSSPGAGTAFEIYLPTPKSQ